ncbi:MAG: cytochrome b/b6 domain-containing protein, partial [Pseudomonadota bacterium]
MIRLIALIALILSLGLAAPSTAQEAADQAPAADPRAATGGAQTLDDILARQRGEAVESRERDPAAAAGAAAGLAEQLGVRGAVSDSDVWSALRFNSADVTVSAGGPVAEVLVQDSGMAWYEFRSGPLKTYGGWLLIGTLGALVLFFLLRGRIRIDGGKSGVTIERFKFVERTAHWLLAGSFIILALTGLLVLFGRVAFIPLFGKEAFAPAAAASKFLHNWLAWVFMASLVAVFLLWVAHNIPNRHDLKWLAKGG